MSKLKIYRQYHGLKLLPTILVVGLTLFGCAHESIWIKDGASSNDFETDKYACLQQSQQQQGEAFLNQYGGAAQSGQVTNWNLYGSCMSSRGWRLQDKEAYQAIASQKRAEYDQKKSAFLAKTKEFDERVKAICAKADYSVILEKTPCAAKDISFEQIADSTKITSEQKKAFVKFRTEIEAESKEAREYMRANGGGNLDRQWVDYLESVQPTIEAYSLDLYKGKSTWGEYNQARKDQAAKGQEAWSRIFNPNQ